MNKYAVRYFEILAKTIIAEADTYEETEEKVQAAVDDCSRAAGLAHDRIFCHGYILPCLIRSSQWARFPRAGSSALFRCI